jgi:hypothetical protein
MREERFEVTVTFDERHGYVPELRSAATIPNQHRAFRAAERLRLHAEKEDGRHGEESARPLGWTD